MFAVAAPVNCFKVCPCCIIVLTNGFNMAKLSFFMHFNHRTGQLLLQEKVYQLL